MEANSRITAEHFTGVMRLARYLEEHAEQGRIDAQVAARLLARLDEVMALVCAPAIGSTH